MIEKVGEDDIICDLAETYGILNYRELSPDLVATLVLGLRDDSRVKRKYNNTKVTVDQLMTALIVDSLQFIAWTKTKSAKHGTNKPESLYKKFTTADEEEKDELISFTTAEEYEKYMTEKRKGWK